MNALCPKCKMTVTVSPVVSLEEFWRAIEKNMPAEVIHTSDHDGDHRWQLSETDKANLRTAKREGRLSSS
jgi:hypothetical protein